MRERKLDGAGSSGSGAEMYESYISERHNEGLRVILPAAGEPVVITWALWGDAQRRGSEQRGHKLWRPTIAWRDRTPRSPRSSPDENWPRKPASRVVGLDSQAPDRAHSGEIPANFW